jgi:hypothetical protein
MTIKEMQFDVKMKLNKVDSQSYRNLKVPEIDWALNEALELFIKMVAFPRIKTRLGFENVQRNTDNIRTLVVSSGVLPITGDVFPITGPLNYWHFISGNVTMTKDNCTAQARIKIRQHDDEFESSPFDKSSFEWRTVNAVFNSDGLSFFTDGTFTITNAEIQYVRRPAYIHNAEDYAGGTYNLPSGVTLVGTQDCELPMETHREIVDIAVLILSGQLQTSDYQLKFSKLNFNNLNN